jgi:hypothetical protein
MVRERFWRRRRWGIEGHIPVDTEKGRSMDLTVEALNILLLLLPGFLSGQVLYSFFRVEEVAVSKRILDALLFSFVIYLSISVFVVWEPLAQVKSVDGSLVYLFSSNSNLIWGSLGSVVFVPMLIGFFYFNDHIHTLLRKLKITTKTSRANTWNDAFLTQNRHIVVTLKDGRRVRGYPTMFSTDPNEGFIYLFNPAWINDAKASEGDSDYIESNCHGFLLNRENIDLIEFTLDAGEALGS